MTVFQSAPPVRAETDDEQQIAQMGKLFQSAPPVRAETPLLHL